jgi:kinesin family member C2/C3
LNFSTNVCGIELGPTKKYVDTSELQKMKQMLEKAKQEVRLKDENIHN